MGAQSTAPSPADPVRCQYFGLSRRCPLMRPCNCFICQGKTTFNLHGRCFVLFLVIVMHCHEMMVGFFNVLRVFLINFSFKLTLNSCPTLCLPVVPGAGGGDSLEAEGVNPGSASLGAHTWITPGVHSLEAPGLLPPWECQHKGVIPEDGGNSQRDNSLHRLLHLGSLPCVLGKAKAKECLN